MTPIGTIRTPFHDPAETPIQPSRASGVRVEVVLERAFHAGLKDLEGFERIWLLYLFHRASEARMVVTPYLDNRPHGVFATRAPARPCAIGLSVVRLLGISEGVVTVADIDVLDHTPLLDIKPYVPEFDSFPGSRAGWIEECGRERTTGDRRFVR